MFEVFMWCKNIFYVKVDEEKINKIFNWNQKTCFIDFKFLEQLTNRRSFKKNSFIVLLSKKSSQTMSLRFVNCKLQNLMINLKTVNMNEFEFSLGVGEIISNESFNLKVIEDASRCQCSMSCSLFDLINLYHLFQVVQ